MKHLILPGFRSPTTSCVLLNMDKWNSLPPDLQKLIDMAGRDAFSGSAQKSLKWDQDAMDMCEKYNIEVVRLPEEDVKELRKKCVTVWDEVAKDANSYNKEIIDLFKKVLLD